MKKTLLAASICFFLNNSFCQVEFKNANVGRTVEMEDFNGRSLLKKYDPDVSGTPFINTDWVLAKITLASGNEKGPMPVKLNLESNELYFMDSNGKDLIALDGWVKKIDFINFYSKDNIRYVFKSGYPATDKQSENYFYQSFTEGKVELLGKRFKYIQSVKDELTGEITKEFVDGALTLYVYTYNKMQVLNPSKDFVVSLLKDKEKDVNRYIDNNKINFRKVPDLIKLFNYYNSL